MHRSSHRSLSIAILGLLSLVLPGQAELPDELHYQGRIVVDGINFDGTGQFKFLLYHHTDSGEVDPSFVDVPIWSNASRTPAGMTEPATAVSLPVSHGLYAVGLGDTALANMAALPASLLPQLPYDQVFLRVWFSDGSGFQQLAPDQPLRSAPFALHAGRAESVPDGSIGTLALAPGAVTAAHIEPGAVSQLGNPNGSIPDALQMDALGHAGIGTVNPQAALHVAGGSNVTAAKLLSTIEWPSPYGFGFADVAYNGNGLLAVSRYSVEGSEVEFWDITVPEAPVWRGELIDGQITNGHLYDSILNPIRLAFDPAGQLLAIASFETGQTTKTITLVSVEDAAEPSPIFQSVLQDGVGGFENLDFVGALAFAESDSRLLAVASQQWGLGTFDSLSLIDVTDPASPQLMSVLEDNMDGFDRLAEPSDLAIRGSLLAIASGEENAVTLIDIADPEGPRLLAVLENGVETAGHTYTGLAGLIQVELKGNLLAAAAWGSPSFPESLTLVEIADPENPQHHVTLLNEGETEFLNGPVSVALGNNDLLALGSESGYLPEDPWGDRVTLFDVSDPATPVFLQEIRDGQGEFGSLADPEVLFAESLLMIAGHRDSTLTIVDPFFPTTGVAGMLVEQRIGIGVEAPEAALHVSGDVRFDKALLFSVETPRLNLGIENEVDASGGAAIGRANKVRFDGFALGSNNTASGSSAFSLGRFSIASGNFSMALGEAAIATDSNAMAFGKDTAATGEKSLAMGYRAEASGDEAIALGGNAKAEGLSSVAIGDDAWASGDYAYALGDGAKASGISATAMGDNTQAGGFAATSMGRYTVAPSYVETAMGVYNTVPTTVYSDASWDARDRLLVIGNGSSDLLRTDLLTIYKDGRLNHAGSISAVGDISTLSNFRYVLPRLRKYQVPASAFDPWRSDTEYIRGDGYIQYPFGGSTTSAVFKAPVQLPDGASITKLSVYYMDNFENPGGGGFTVYILYLQADLRRIGTGTGDVASEAVAATLSTSTYGVLAVDEKYALETSSIDLPVVENDNYQYWVEVDFSVNTPSSGLRFCGATIEYTQDTVAP